MWMWKLCEGFERLSARNSAKIRAIPARITLSDDRLFLALKIRNFPGQRLAAKDADTLFKLAIKRERKQNIHEARKKKACKQACNWNSRCIIRSIHNYAFNVVEFLFIYRAALRMPRRRKGRIRNDFLMKQTRERERKASRDKKKKKLNTKLQRKKKHRNTSWVGSEKKLIKKQKKLKPDKIKNGRVEIKQEGGGGRPPAIEKSIRRESIKHKFDCRNETLKAQSWLMNRSRHF